MAKIAAFIGETMICPKCGYSEGNHVEAKTDKEKYLDFAENYLELVKLRTNEGIINDNDGSFINPSKLSKIEKEELKKALQTIDDIIDLIKEEYQLTRFS